MNDNAIDRKRDVICGCSGTTATQIKRLVDRGVADLDGISQATGACSGCGACDTDILALLAEYASPVSADAIAGHKAEDLPERNPSPIPTPG